VGSTHPDELMDTFAEAEALKATLDALELGVVRELEATGAVKGAGWASTQDYVTHTAGGHKGTGPAMVRLAAAVAEPVLSPVGSALADGWLSVAKAHVIERAIDRLPGDPEVRARGVQVLLAEAKSLDATELRKVALHLASLVDPEGDARRDEKALDRLERAAHLGRHLTITDDQAGGAWIKGRCTSEAAALIKATLIPLAAPQPSTGPVCDPHTCREPGCSHTGRDPRDHGARMLDALLDACRLLQTAEVLPESHGTLPRLTITIDYTQLLTLSGLGEAETGERLSASAIRQLCCDAEIIPIVMAGTSQVLDVGRQMRLASAAIWKALVARDKHCRFKNCQRPHQSCATPTTSRTGSTADQPHWTTWSCSADTTTASSTPNPGRSGLPHPAPTSSSHPSGPPGTRLAQHHPTGDALRRRPNLVPTAASRACLTSPARDHPGQVAQRVVETVRGERRTVSRCRRWRRAGTSRQAQRTRSRPMR
jgi:hypothetical protein